MKKFLRLVPLALAVVFSGLALRAATPFPQEGSDLKPDPAAHFGTLPNGLRYVVLANHEPKGRAAFRLVVEAGSLYEKDDQQGLAHFLEHLAFNGSTHYAPGTLVEFFQRMGMSFGGDTNAFTSFDRTVYQLELPDTKEATLAEGLQVFADYAGGLLLKPESIEKERNIILSEKRTRDSVSYRTFVDQFKFVLDGTIIPNRMPIGQAPIIEQAMRERFADFWDTWYRPERMTVVIVGDFDSAAVEKQITAAMSDIKARAPERPKPDFGKLAAPTGLRPYYHYESESPNTDISLATYTPYSHEPDTSATRLKYLARDIAHSMINRRFTILAKKENAPFISARANVSDQFDFFRETTIDISCKSGQWAEALAVGDQELRRALQYGFQPTELKEVVANYLNGLQQAVKTASTRHSNELADEISSGIVDREIFTSPADDLALLQPALEKITVDDCLAALRQAWSVDQRYVMVSGNSKIDGDAAAAITAAYTKAHEAAVAAPEKQVDLAWGYTDFGPAGKIAQRSHVDDLDITLITFENGVRLNLKKTDFAANQIQLMVRVGSGQLTEPKDQPGLANYASGTYTPGGLGKLSADDLRRVLSGKTVGVGMRVGTDAFTFSGGTNREDLILELQYLTARIVDPGYRAEAARQAQKGIEQQYLALAHSVAGPIQLEVLRALAGGDARFGTPSQADLTKRTLDEVRAWLTPDLTRGAMEVAIVGDMDIDATIDAVARTLGALPARSARPALDDAKKVAIPATPFVKDYSVPTEIPKALVTLFWPTTDGIEVHRARRLNMLASVFGDRLRVTVREKLGGSYSPSANSSASDTFPGFGFMSTNLTVDPPRANEIADAAVAVAADLQKNGVTEDELTRAKLPALTSIRESVRSNGYWLGNVLSRAQEKPEVLDWARSRESDITAITAAELSELAKQYLAPERVFRVIVQPQLPAAPADAAPAAPATPPATKP